MDFNRKLARNKQIKNKDKEYRFKKIHEHRIAKVVEKGKEIQTWEFLIEWRGYKKFDWILKKI